ncbi:tRNA (adenosine(37)-N6)-threonylcarbamoyltransferase complex ATPase subunit type 1 TsaE [Sphingomonas sp. 1P06PA]|uniref:tRNA (adenosine(37)-N6)-threonylcarbamoyltransferase complex ATPase subunit type 1 TsaE n=1 Tax=Sphingomonas sp. 1P06PA TaxID=554121 RepID=UPI0039A6EC60
MIRLANEGATLAFGAGLARVLQPGDVVALSGDLGAGKTTLARGLLAALGHDGEIASPTFPIVIPYDDLAVPVWHVDLYRLDRADAIDELGLDDALADGALIIEWPGRMGDRLWPHALRLWLAPDGGGRCLTAQVPPSWEARWPPR